jgi:hypothetical protein
MTKEDIIRMAREAGINEATSEFYCDELGRMLAAEREECATLCDWLNGEPQLTPAGCAAAIRARRQA